MCTRMEADFQWLVDSLQQELPFTVIPALIDLPQLLDQESILRKKRFYQKFVNNLL